MVELSYDSGRDELTSAPRPVERRYVFGAFCSFHGPIQEAGRLPTRNSLTLPCCPSCGKILYELESKEDWDRLVLNHAEKKKDPNYPAFMEWFGAQRPCRPMNNQKDFDGLRAEFDATLQ